MDSNLVDNVNYHGMRFSLPVLRSLAVMEQTHRAQPFFKDLRAALTSSAVTRDIRLSELLMVSMLSVLSMFSSS